MPEADVLYTDVKFARRNANETTSLSDETTYSEVRIANAQVSAELPAGSKQPVVPDKGSKVTPERVALLIVSTLLAAAVIALAVTLYKNIHTTEYLQRLQNDNEPKGGKKLTSRCCETEPNNTMQIFCPKPPQVKRNQSYPSCEGGWEHNGEQCYLFTTTPLSWEDGRNECKRLGGDLVKIDNVEEQRFLQERLKDKMDEPEDKFWIGLTDSKTEGDWLWVDGSRLKSWPRFWSKQEPDNWKGEDPEGENCVRMGEKAQTKNLSFWFDKSCKTRQKSICEKLEMRQYTVLCLNSSSAQVLN